MSDDLVSRLERADGIGACLSGDAQFVEALCHAAATALTEARAEIERLRAKPLAIANARLQKWIDLHLGDVMSLSGEVEQFRAERDAAESELSTLRARVREVVGPFANAAADLDDTDKDSTDIWEAPCAMQINVGHLRAARQLVEEVK